MSTLGSEKKDRAKLRRVQHQLESWNKPSQSRVHELPCDEIDGLLRKQPWALVPGIDSIQFADAIHSRTIPPSSILSGYFETRSLNSDSYLPRPRLKPSMLQATLGSPCRIFRYPPGFLFPSMHGSTGAKNPYFHTICRQKEGGRVHWTW